MKLLKSAPPWRTSAAILSPLLLLLSSCNGDDGPPGDGGGGGTTSQVFADVAFDRSSGPLGTTFQASAVVVGATGTVQATWELPDGTTATGLSVATTPDASGLQTISLTVVDEQGVEASAEGDFLVFGDGSSGNSLIGVEIPLLPGDVDGDGELTLNDCLKIARAVDGTEPFQSEQAFDAADVWFDGVISDLDYSLASQGLDAGGTLPSALVPAQGAGGLVVTVVDPSLLIADAVFTAQVAGGSEVPLERAVLGRGTFVVEDGLVPGLVEVLVRADGFIVSSIPFEVLEDPVISGPPGALFAELMDLEGELAPIARVGLEQFLTESAVEEEGRIALLAIWDEAQAQLVVSRQEFTEQLGGLPSETLILLERYAVANGMMDQILRGRELVDMTRDALTEGLTLDDLTLETLCALSAYKQSAVPTVGSFIATACEYGGTAAAVVLGIVAAAGSSTVVVSAGALALLKAIVTTCVLASGPVAVAEVVAEVAPDMRLSTLAIVADPKVLEPPMTTESMITVRLTVPTDPSLCAAGGSLRDKIISKAVKKVLTRTPLLKNILLALKVLPDKVEQQLVGAIVSAVTSALGTVVDDTEVAMQLDSVGAYLCSLGTSLGLPVDPNGTLIGPNPATAGTLEFPSGGDGVTAVFTCNPDIDNAAPIASFSASKDICGRALEAQAEVTCGILPVTITMGDNGSATDDIFSVEVDGETVLTTSVPVTSVSTTIDLSLGEHGVVMRGLAAPDGIGTYFIQFSGATVVSGDPLSGTDLVPGTSKSFVISVGN